MIIHGNYVGTVLPKPDWNQEDPTKADYIKGKEAVEQKIADAQTAAETAQTAADNAQTAADNAQSAAVDARVAAETAEQNAKNYADSLHMISVVAVPAAGWSEAAPYTQRVAVEGIAGTDTPHYGIVYSADADTALAEKEAFAFVDDLDTADGSVTFTCFEDKPEVDLTIQMEVNR